MLIFSHIILTCFLLVNPRVIKLARAKLESKVEKEIKAQKKQQSLRRRKAAKLNGDVENEVGLFTNYHIRRANSQLYLKPNILTPNREC